MATKVDTTPALFKELVALSAEWNEHDLVPEAQKAQCRAIGQQLNTLGGMELMQGAYYHAKGRNRCASMIQAYWDGIGEWRW